MKPISMEYEDGGVEGWVPRQGIERGHRTGYVSVKS